MMEGLFRKIAIYLCKPIYCLIVYMYKIFYNIATTRFLQSEIVQEISANIYTLVSVVMLFAFSVTILSAIVNPDLLSDGKKGVKAVFKRAIIALMLIVVIPFAFDELYKIQETIMKNSLIEKIVVGIEYNCNSSDKSKCEAGGNGGQVIAGTLMSAVLYLDDEMADADGNVNVSVSVSEYYSKMIAEDLPKYIGAVAKNINATAINPENANISNDEAYAFKFNGLIAIVVGLVTVYILVIFAIDVAVRVFKMAFMELTAPISIVSYVAAGDKILSSWFKELGKTYAELFVRVAAIAFYLFLVSNLSSFMEQFKNSDWTLVLKAFLMVGMLIFAKQVPDMIGKIFGVEIKSQGGIAGRLGNMAGVGKVAQNAWKGLTNVAKATPLLAGAGIGALAGKGVDLLGRAGGKFAKTGLGQKINGNAVVQKIKSAAGNASSKVSGFGSKAMTGVKNATSAINAAAHEDNAYKAYQKLRYNEGGKGSVEKDQKEWKKTEDAKARAKAYLSETVGSTILDKDGKVVNASAATTAAYSSMVDKMKGHTEQQQEALKKYNSTQHDLFVAQKDNQTINQIRTAIETQMNASTGNVKTKLGDILAQMDLGGITSISDLDTALNSSGVSTTFIDAITGAHGVANNLSSSNLGSVASYSSAVDSAQEAFSRADSTLNDVIDKATSDQKIVLKEARTASKNMNEANTK
ncbi:putative uncharacterized protein [Clostridium sp. CAG:433]|nr:putative uncharacterized protein [Clostridium sp. CAG:433]